MSDQLYPIRNGDVTLYVRQSGYRGTDFDFAGLTVEGDDNYYVSYESNFDTCSFDQRPCVGLDKLLFEHYKTLADAQLADYLERHMHDALDLEAFEKCWHNAGVQPKMQHRKEIKLERVIDGLVGIEINGVRCVYNLAAHEPAGYKEKYHPDKELGATPLQVLYGDQLQELLLLEQHKRGLAPPVYSELARLQEFLMGKHSLKLVMKDGAVHELKPHYNGDVSMHTLLYFTPTAAVPFSLNDSYDCKPQFGSNRPLDDLEYLQYGKQRFVIDAAALGQFTPISPEEQ